MGLRAWGLGSLVGRGSVVGRGFLGRRSLGVGGSLAIALAALIALSSCGGSSTPNTPTPTTPTVTAVAPSSGPAAGGTSVRITGSNFAAGASVTLGGAAATNVVVESATSITATTGAHAAGVTDVTVTVSGRSGSMPGAFTYQASNPPVISGIAVRGSRANQPANFADVGEEITVTATVTDPDTAASALTYTWSAPSGTFTGTGASVKWRAPSTAGTVRLTLVVSDGTAVTGTADVSVHDSIKEVGDMAVLFLRDFSDSKIPPETVMRNFSTSDRCADETGKELQDVKDNRERYQIESYVIGAATVGFSFAGRPCSYPSPSARGDACAAVPATWNSLCLQTNEECVKGEHTHANGIDYVTAVYEQSQWKLCASSYKGINGVKMMR